MTHLDADILIVGGGMAGLTAALYALRAGKSALVIEREAFGGQIASAPRVDNYPGLPRVSGLQLADALLAQALDLGAQIELDAVRGLSPAPGGFALACEGRDLWGRAVVIASGARHRPLGVPGEDALVGHGVSYCAVCDGAFHKGEYVAVVGGGNTAAQAALFLADMCQSVAVIQEFPHFTCDARDLAALRAAPAITLMPSARVTALLGDTKLTGARVRHEAGDQTGDSLLPVTGLFVCVGRVADNQPFATLLDLDAQGFIRAGEDCLTNVPGVFAAGDCRAKTVRQLTTAAADGAVAALAACRFLG